MAEGVSATLKLPFAATETVNSAEQLCRLLQREAEHAQATHERWLRQPHAPWVQELAAELSADAAARSALLAGQRKLQGVSEDATARWEAGAELASTVVELWLEGKSLEQVLAKCDSLGHAQQRSGLVLSGRFARLNLAVNNEVSLRVQVVPSCCKAINCAACERPVCPGACSGSSWRGSSATGPARW